MPLPNRIFSIIVEAPNADFSAHTYSQVYAGAAASPTINGVSVTMAAGSKLDIVVDTISATNGIFLLGDKKDTFTGSVVLG